MGIAEDVGGEFIAKAVEKIRKLRAQLGSDQLPSSILCVVRELIGSDYVLLASVVGDLVDPFEHSEGWQPKAYSLTAIRKALKAHAGYWHGSIEEDPSESQTAHKILSCVAARLESGSSTIGAIYSDIREGKKRFAEEDAKRLKLLADLLAVYLDDFYVRHRPLQSIHQAGIDQLLVGETPCMLQLKFEVQRYAKLSIPILIRGERGTGKEIVATLLHTLSPRTQNEIVVVNCASISKELFESELFGHEKGAFTGAAAYREGKIRKAERGTLFFDEVADMPLEFQIKLLRLFQNRTFYRVGSDVPVGPVDVRFLFATNRDLEKMTHEGTLREDFYDRLMMGKVLSLPSLRERRQDIPFLAQTFAVPKGIEEAGLELLLAVEDWSGNVRQLESVVRAAGSSVTGRTISREAIQCELKSRKLDLAKPTIPFEEIRHQYKNAGITPAQLKDLLVTKFGEYHTWSKVAKHLGCSTKEEVKSFQQWIFNLQKQGVLPKEI